VTRDAHVYLVPVPDLTVTQVWDVGDVRFLPAEHIRGLVRDHRSGRTNSLPGWFDQHVDDRVAEVVEPLSVVQVASADARTAYTHVADAVAILRLLQHARAPRVDTDLQTFGLPGQVAQWNVELIDLSAGPGLSYFRGGAAPGWTFSADDYAAFQRDPGLQFLGTALAESDRTALQRRALLGTRLLSTSTLEQDPDQKLLAAVMAVEVLLGDDGKGPKKYRLARRHADLACSVPQASMCGRDRPSCPYLSLDPDVREQRQELQTLHDRARNDVRVLCSEHLRLVDLYNDRSSAVHDGTVGLDLKEVRNSLYPVYRWLIPEVLAWYAAHPDDGELTELDDEIRRTVAARPPEPVPPET